MTRDELMSEAQRFECADIAAQLAVLHEAPVTVSIGVLGEFNSGKSTLVNALLGHSVLPVGERPTTASATVVEFSRAVQDLQFFIEHEPGVRENVGAADFGRAAVGRLEGTPVLVAPTTTFLADGYRIFDTPGLASLDRAHADVTLGLLPLLDGALLCFDAQQGELTRGMIEFLERPDVQPVRRHFVFACNRCDTKPENAVAEVRAKTLASLRSIYTDDEWSELSEGDRIACTRATERLRGSGDGGIPELERVMETAFVGPRRRLEESRRAITLTALRGQLCDRLRDMRDNLVLTNEDLRKKERDIAEELNGVKARSVLAQKRITEAVVRIRERLARVANDYTPRFENVDAEAAARIGNEIGGEIGRVVTSETMGIGAGLALPDCSHIGDGLHARLQEVQRVRDLGVLVATAALTAAVAPGASAAANTGEAVAGAGSAAAGEAARRTASGRVVSAAGAVAKDATKSQRFLGFVGDLIKSVNPLEHAGDIVASRVKRSIARSALMALAEDVARQVEQDLTETFLSKVLSEASAELRERQRSLDAAKDIRRREEGRLVERRQALDAAVARLAAE